MKKRTHAALILAGVIAAIAVTFFTFNKAEAAPQKYKDQPFQLGAQCDAAKNLCIVPMDKLNTLWQSNETAMKAWKQCGTRDEI